MGSVTRVLRALLLFLDVGGAQVLAMGKSAGAEIDIKCALIGTALGVAISSGFLVLKICLTKRHLFETISPKERAPRLNLNFSERDAQVIEL